MPASVLLGEIAYHQGDLTFAIKTYESALALPPGHVQLRERLATWRSEAAVTDNLPRRQGRPLHDPVRRPGQP